jgi:hypothetical protein
MAKAQMTLWVRLANKITWYKNVFLESGRNRSVVTCLVIHVDHNIWTSFNRKKTNMFTNISF